MLDFIVSALPFIIIGVCVAIICNNYHKKRDKDGCDNYLSEGMCIGMCLGVAFSMLPSIHLNMGMGISLGMLVGEIIGILLKKK